MGVYNITGHRIRPPNLLYPTLGADSKIQETSPE